MSEFHKVSPNKGCDFLCTCKKKMTFYFYSITNQLMDFDNSKALVFL